MIAGIETATRGDIWVDNQELRTLPARHLPRLRRRIGIVLQNPHLIHDQTAFENVALPLVIEGFNAIEIGKRVRAALDKVGLLEKEDYLPDELSTGEQQRLGLARAVVNKPVLLLADEPTGNLDPDLSREIMQLFSDFNNVGTTVLIATHDIALIKEFNQPVLHIEQGVLTEVPSELYTRGEYDEAVDVDPTTTNPSPVIDPVMKEEHYAKWNNNPHAERRETGSFGFSTYLAQHRHALRHGLRQITKNPLGSLMTIAVISITLVLPAGLLLILSNIQQNTAMWQTTTSISVYLQPSSAIVPLRKRNKRCKKYPMCKARVLFHQTKAYKILRSNRD